MPDSTTAATDRSPLAGLRVVALEQAVAGPFCSRQLADLGAEVIKVERPDGGDFARGYDDAFGGVSAYFAWLNRGKRSIVLDLKEVADRAALDALVARADIFVHNLAPGAVDRLGLGYDTLAQRHEGLIWCGISGYGPDGPYRDKKAYDLLLQAESGVIGVTGDADAPAKVGVSIADIGAGHYAYSSILAALLGRARTGRGERIDISMLECLTESMMPMLYSWIGTGAIPGRAGLRHNLIVPYGVYACADGAVNLAIQNDREWHRFCAALLDQPELATDPRFATNAARVRHRRELEELIERRFAGLRAEALVALLDRAGIANGRINDVPAVVAHPQLAARARWTEVGSPVGPIPALRPPHNLGGSPAAIGAVPALGEHTAAILRELGLTAPASSEVEGEG